MDYYLAKLCIPKKGDDWFILYSFRDPVTGKMVPIRKRGQLNKVKNKKDKKRIGLEMVAQINKDILDGWNPLNEEQRKVHNKDFYWWFQERINYSKAKHGVYNVQRLEDCMERLKEFAPLLKTNEVDYKFLLDFEKHLIERGNIGNTIADRMARIKIIVGEVVRSGQIDYHKNPFLKYKILKTRTDKTRLTMEQINIFENAELKGLEDVARDMYIISFYCGGVRFGDICRLKKEMFTTHLKYTMNKTTMDRHIKVMPQVQKIIDKYINTKGSYLFELGIDWENEEKSINKKDTEMLKHLKRACQKAEIPKVTFHTSRNSLSDHASNLGYDALTIRDLLGLRKVSTAEIYLKSNYIEKSELVMDKMFTK